MNSVGSNNKNIVNSVGLLNDSVAICSHVMEYYWVNDVSYGDSWDEQ
jgi:hypothetical protein